jgi:putative hemolysin
MKRLWAAMIALGALALGACVPLPPPTPAEPAPTVTVGIANPASENCVQQGGTLTIAERPDGGQYGICLFEDNRQCEEWALLRGECPAVGVRVTGYATDAARFCAITGGTYTITANAGQATEAGTCALPGGATCPAADYLSGACTATSAGPTPAPPTAAASALRPPGAEVCNGAAQVMLQALPGVEVTVEAEPVTINDPARDATGMACRAIATGTGQTFESPIDTVEAISEVMEQGGWQEDMMLLADGPTGTATGFRSGELVCVVAAGWSPGPAVTCPADRPISECQVPPDQQMYEVTVDCAASAAD